MTETQGGSSAQKQLHCSFCNKSMHAVRRIVAGPGVNICDECVQVCVDILADDRPLEAPPPPQPEPIKWPSNAHCNLCRMPMLLEDMMPVEEVGPICRPCITRIQIALSRRVDR